MWGTGASSTQTEGAAPSSDWRGWERSGNAPASGEGNGFSTRYGDDFAQFSRLGLRHHRLSIEWARIEPVEKDHDHDAISRYRAMLGTARDIGVMPWACLHHFTLPAWFAAQGGFANPRNLDAWRRHVDFIATTFGDLVTGWKPVNESNIYASLAYRGLGWPPGHNDDAEAALVDETIHIATAEAAARLRETGAPVASVFSLSPIVELDETEETKRLAAMLYDRLWRPSIELYRDGAVRIVGREAVLRSDLAGSFDLIGFSYYSAFGVSQGHLTLHPVDASRSPLGYAVWPDGLSLVLAQLHAELPAAPLLVAEYGIGTEDDAQRAAYLERGLEIVHQAIANGVDVRGFFHWTGVDNYEWLHGYDLPFGLLDRKRNVRPSAEILRRAALGLDEPSS
jgi:beta-glucosidase